MLPPPPLLPRDRQQQAVTVVVVATLLFAVGGRWGYTLASEEDNFGGLSGLNRISYEDQLKESGSYEISYESGR